MIHLSFLYLLIVRDYGRILDVIFYYLNINLIKII